MKSFVAMSRLVISCAMRRAISSSRLVRRISVLGAGRAHVLGRNQDDGGTRMHTAFGCHPREGLEQKLETRAVVDDVLGRGAGPRLDLGEPLSPSRQ